MNPETASINPELKQQLVEIIETFAGQPLEIKRMLKRHKARYVVVQRGIKLNYIIRGQGIPNKLIVTI